MDEFDSQTEITFGLYIYIPILDQVTTFQGTTGLSWTAIVSFMQALVALAALCLRTLGVDAD